MLKSQQLLRYFSSLQHYLNRKDWTGALTFLEKCPSDHKIDQESLSTLMLKLYSNNRHSEVHKLILLMPSFGRQPSELDYTLAIEVCIHANKIVQAFNIFYQTQLFGVPLDACLYSSLLSACNKEVGARNIKWILSCMARDQAIASIQTCISLIKVGIMLKDYSLVESMIKIMHQAEYDMPSKLINSFISKNPSESSEYKSCKMIWNSIQQNAYPTGNSEKENSLKVKLNENTLNYSKNPFSLEFIIVPKENNKKFSVLDTSSDDESSD